MNSFLKSLNGSEYAPVSQNLGSDYCCSGKCSTLLRVFALGHLLAHWLDAIQWRRQIMPQEPGSKFEGCFSTECAREH